MVNSTRSIDAFVANKDTGRSFRDLKERGRNPHKGVEIDDRRKVLCWVRRQSVGGVRSERSGIVVEQRERECVGGGKDETKVTGFG